MTTYTFDANVAMDQYNKRKAENAAKKKIDNASLYAGSPMYYYCRGCGEHTQTLSEGDYYTKIAKYCNPCQILNDHGLIK